MDAKEQARQQVAELVGRFKADKQRKTYVEQEMRLYFILPLFRALGWTIENPSEVTAEEQISRGFVDFGFYLNGVPRFYLETKRVSDKLNDTENMRQSINYSYLKGVTWAVLTDFDKLIIFNAEWAEKDPVDTIFMDFTSDELVSRFDDLWLLSKASIQEREIDHIAEKFHKKAKKEPVTVSLFNSLTDWRKRLFDEIRIQGLTLWAQDNRAVDNAVQKFFDRLIFMRTVEDRGIEEPHLKTIQRQNKPDVVFEQLLKKFRELDAVYNSNLFAEHALDTMKVYDPGLITEIIEGLYKPKSSLIQYDFNAITADVLGAVYEQYLGFKATDPSASVDNKSIKRKSQGIYYTPQYVVRYIVENTLGKLLASGVDPHSITIVDPACGSGSFLIEAFDVLDRFLATQEKDVPARERRERILKENLYGVDLDEQAVEVTRLNLMLRASFQRTKLPLLTHIAHGNSLIHSDEVAGTGLGFDWQDRFSEVFERGGFDVVIGNPPYVRQESLGSAFKAYARDPYQQTYAGTNDLYVYFMERGYSLLREGGKMGYIVPNKWMRANYGKGLRTYLQDKIETLIDFGDLPVFPTAITYPLIVTMGKNLTLPSPHGEGDKTVQVATVASLPTASNDTLEPHLNAFYPVQRAHLDPKGWTLAAETGQALLDKLKARGVPLGEYVDGKIYRGILTGYNEAFVIDRVTRDRLIKQDPKSADLIKPFLAGRDVKRYEQPTKERYLIYIAWNCVIEDYPAIHNHLAQWTQQLSERPEVKASRFPWYAMSRYGSKYAHEFEKTKIVVAAITEQIESTLDEKGRYTNDKTTIVANANAYLLGIMNSKVSNYVLKAISSTKQGGFYEIKPMYLEKLPIPRLDLNNTAQKAQHDSIVTLVERMMRLKSDLHALENVLSDKRHDIQADIERTDQKIDKLVYQLYGLTPEEIAIVESK